jgi:DNA-binding transcriptional LysR family regulator
MDRITSLATFVKVVDSGGFAAAARSLEMSPSSVTLHVQAIEERLGVRLLNRSTRKVSLTEIGQAYYQRCVQILTELDDADQIALAMQSKPRGSLRLNVSIPLPSLIAPVIAEYTGLYPETSIDMTMTDRMVDMVEEGFDLAIRNMPVADSSLIVRKIAPYRFVMCATPDYLQRHGIPQRPEDLVKHNCLFYAQSPWRNEWVLNGPNGEQRVAVSGNMRSNSAIALGSAALHGQGLLMTSSFIVAEHIKSGRLMSVMCDYFRTEYSIDAIYPDRHHLSAKVRTFIDMLAQHFREHPVWIEGDTPCGPEFLANTELLAVAK